SISTGNPVRAGYFPHAALQPGGHRKRNQDSEGISGANAVSVFEAACAFGTSRDRLVAIHRRRAVQAGLPEVSRVPAAVLPGESAGQGHSRQVGGGQYRPRSVLGREQAFGSPERRARNRRQGGFRSYRQTRGEPGQNYRWLASLRRPGRSLVLQG